MGGGAPVLWDVVEEHLDEGGFLWERWERALGTPLLRPAQVAARIEERLFANLDGLAVSSAIELILRPALGARNAGIVAAAASALLAQPEGLAPVLDALRSADGPRRDAVVRALALSRRPRLERDLLAMLRDENPSLAAAALEALAFRRIDVGSALLQLLGAQPPELQAGALRAARASSQPVRAQVERACASRVARIQEAAIETGLLLGFRSAYLACQRLADSGEPGSGLALAALAIGGDPADLPRIEGALEKPAL